MIAIQNLAAWDPMKLYMQHLATIQHMCWEDSNLFMEEPKYPCAITWRHRDRSEVQCACRMALQYAPACVGHHIAPEDDDSGDEGINLPDHDEPIDVEEPDEDVHVNLMVHFVGDNFSDIEWLDEKDEEEIKHSSSLFPMFGCQS